MADINDFKSGKDVAAETDADDDDAVTCVDCGTRQSDEAAYTNGWQLAPVVCANCLRWTVTADECCFARPS